MTISTPFLTVFICPFRSPPPYMHTLCYKYDAYTYGYAYTYAIPLPFHVFIWVFINLILNLEG